jgi:hypothetical protein
MPPKLQQMRNIQDYITSELMDWFQENNMEFELSSIKVDKGILNILCSEKFCLKIYDRIGHGFGVTINVTEKYDESIYENDKFALYWVFEYLKVKETSSFKSRTEKQYLENLPNMIVDIKNVIPKLNKMDSTEWKNMTDWINIEVKKQYT